MKHLSKLTLVLCAAVLVTAPALAMKRPQEAKTTPVTTEQIEVKLFPNSFYKIDALLQSCPENSHTLIRKYAQLKCEKEALKNMLEILNKRMYKYSSSPYLLVYPGYILHEQKRHIDDRLIDVMEQILQCKKAIAAHKKAHQDASIRARL